MFEKYFDIYLVHCLHKTRKVKYEIMRWVYPIVTYVHSIHFEVGGCVFF